MVITPVKIDDLTYGYNLDGNGNLVNNKLNHIDDPVSSLLCSYDIDDQSQDNYLYDAIGNLTKDNAEGIDNIEWNAYGKIKKIIRTFSSAEKSLEFVYDAQGNRVCKIVKPRYANMDGTKTRDEWDTYNSASWLYTFYVRDASGNIMTTYTKTGSEIENNVLKLDEVMLYGSSRIGTREIGVELTNITIPTTKFSRVLGLKRYEIGNHLGNVLTTFTDRKYQIQNTGVVTGYKTYIASAQDYYPFGMIMNGRNWNTSGYRFGFNGKENDNEVKGDGNQQDYGMRIYDPRIGKFLSVDPLFRKYPELSTYQFASNTPIQAIDLDGLEAYYAANGTFLKWGEIKGDKAPVVLVTYRKVENKIVESLQFLQIGGRNLTHIEFEQTAAFAFNETYKGNTIDKYRIANTIVNHFYFYKKLYSTFQKSMDHIRGGDDSHEKRLTGDPTNAGPNATPNYAKYFSKTEEERNSDNEMKNSNAAALNAFNSEGVDYTTSTDGANHATNWAGKRAGSRDNTYYYRDSPYAGTKKKPNHYHYLNAKSGKREPEGFKYNTIK